MKVNNLEKFYSEVQSDPNFEKAKRRSTIVTRGDILKLYSADGSETNWHAEPQDGDKWWKMTFDGGKTYPIQMKFDTSVPTAKFILNRSDFNTSEWGSTLILNQQTNESYYSINFSKTFIINEDFDLLKEGNVKAQYEDQDGYLHDLENFGYKFNESASSLVVNVSGNFAIEFDKIVISIKLGTSNATIPTIPTPIYSTQVSAIPSVYDNVYGMCNYLDNEVEKIECLTKLSDVDVIKIKAVTASSDITGDVVLKFNISPSFNSSSTTIEKVVSISANEAWQEIVLENPVNGILTISREWNDSRDTLKDTLNLDDVISLIITEIKVETSSK